MKTVALEIGDDINILVLTGILKRATKHFHLFGARGFHLYPLMTLVPSGTAIVEEPLPLVFPKVTNVDLGMARSSGYLIGQDFHTNFIIAMIEFRYSTLLADSFNAKEYDYYITSIGDNSSKLSSDVVCQLGEQSFNLYDNVIKMWLVKDGDLRKYMFGYVKDDYVKFDEKNQRLDTEFRYILVSRRTEVMLNQRISDNIRNIDVSTVPLPNIVWVNGPLGCGKTSHLKHQFVVPVYLRDDDIILTMTKEEPKEIRDKLIRRYPTVSEKI